MCYVVNVTNSTLMLLLQKVTAACVVLDRMTRLIRLDHFNAATRLQQAPLLVYPIANSTYSTLYLMTNGHSESA